MHISISDFPSLLLLLMGCHFMVPVEKPVKYTSFSQHRNGRSLLLNRFLSSSFPLQPPVLLSLSGHREPAGGPRQLPKTPRAPLPPSSPLEQSVPLCWRTQAGCARGGLALTAALSGFPWTSRNSVASHTAFRHITSFHAVWHRSNLQGKFSVTDVDLVVLHNSNTRKFGAAG